LLDNLRVFGVTFAAKPVEGSRSVRCGQQDSWNLDDEAQPPVALLTDRPLKGPVEATAEHDRLRERGQRAFVSYTSKSPGAEFGAAGAWVDPVDATIEVFDNDRSAVNRECAP
jgi:hypothetical protein